MPDSTMPHGSLMDEAILRLTPLAEHLESTAKLNQLLAELVDVTCRHAVIDLANVVEANSLTLSHLLILRHRLINTGCLSCSLVNQPPRLAELIAMLGADPLFAKAA